MGWLRVWLRVIPIVAFAVAMGADGSSGLRRQYEDLRGKAEAASRAGHWQEAKHLWEQAHAIAPDAFQPMEGLAAVAAQLGQTDDAFAWLHRVYDGRSIDTAHLRTDVHFTSLHDDPRWGSLISKLLAEWEQAKSQSAQPPPDLDSQSAPAFKSYRKLSAVFDRQERDLELDRWRLPPSDYLTEMLAIERQRVLALRRYLAEHPKASDRADAAWNAIEAQIWPRYVQRLSDRWGEFGKQVLEEIHQFLREYPESPHCAQAAIDRAFITFGVRPDGGTNGRPWRDEDILALDQSLADLAREHAGTTKGGLALAWRLVLATDSSTTVSIPELRAMKLQLDRQYGQDRDVEAVMWNYRGAVEVLTAGIDRFNATDLGGTHWTASSFKGKVTLIDFWATWCGPCVGEIPTIQKAWSTYRDKGLAILGVSLDSEDRARFGSWLTTNAVAWPQVWDGKGYSTPLAKRYEVHGIPFTILVNQDGRVTNVNLSGEALLTRIKELLDAPSEPPR